MSDEEPGPQPEPEAPPVPAAKRAPAAAVSEEEERPIIDLQKLIEGKQGVGGTMQEIIAYSILEDIQERRQDRREEREHKRRLRELELKKEQGAHDSSPEVKELKANMTELTKNVADLTKAVTGKSEAEEREKHDQALVEASVKKTSDEIMPTLKNLQSTVNELAREQKALKENPPETPKPPEKPKSELETTKDTLKTLAEIDDLRGKGESKLPPGSPTEAHVAEKTLDTTEKVITKSMDDAKDMLSQFMEFQLQRERRMLAGQRPEIQEFSEQEKMVALATAAGETAAEAQPPAKPS